MKKRELEEEDFKNLRLTHVDLNRPCDEMVRHAVKMLPGAFLEQHWKYQNRDVFLRYFGHLGPVLWSRTASFHLLFLHGYKILRIWTDSPNVVLVDLDYKLATDLSDLFEVEDSPSSTWKKTAPFKKRLRCLSKDDISIVMLQALVTYEVL